MKKLYALLLLLFTATALAATDNVVNLYMWADYMPMSVIKQFEQQTGIKVNVAEYDSNETLYAKLKTAPNAGYDVIIPSSYYVAKMRKEGMLHKFNKAKLPNLKYLMPSLLNKPFDPHNNYSLPYLWGTTGIVVNKKYINPNSIKTWADLWNRKYKNQLLILDDVREAFSIAFINLGYSINDTNPEHIKAAYQRLKQLMSNIKLFNSDAEQNVYIDEDVLIGMGWNGDIYNAQKENPDLVYIYPQDGFSIWIDCLAIAKNAPHINNAHKFINFIMRPEITKEIVLAQGFSSPNTAATKLLPKAIQNNPIINPDPKILQRGHFQNNIGDSVALYTKYWDLLKIGG
ncbi:MAG: spermidine/putrescine ABC transporter substrate-binding protein [Gammaproteobacteria bacterium]|nr:spermidine/putrescine ABC transporter substrate-binding protein [Gammaproteobacteria bacterium]